MLYGVDYQITKGTTYTNPTKGNLQEFSPGKSQQHIGRSPLPVIRWSCAKIVNKIKYKQVLMEGPPGDRQ